VTKSAGADLNSAKRWPEGRVYRKYASNTASDVDNKVENSFAKGIMGRYRDHKTQFSTKIDTKSGVKGQKSIDFTLNRKKIMKSQDF
jgi:hypothetical protein